MTRSGGLLWVGKDAARIAVAGEHAIRAKKVLQSGFSFLGASAPTAARIATVGFFAQDYHGRMYRLIRTGRNSKASQSERP